MKQIKKKDLVTFSLIWAFIFFIIGVYPAIKNGDIRIWPLVVGFLFLSLSKIKPTVLTVFYILWTKLGVIIGGIVSKLIMLILYFGLLTPISLILKILGKDLLAKKMDRRKSTYWINRETQPQSMKKQF